MIFLYTNLIEDSDNRNKFKEIYTAYSSDMVNAAKSITNNHSAAEDIVHDIFLNIIKNELNYVLELPKLRLRNYLLSATKKRAINYVNLSDNKNIPLDDITDNVASDDDFIQALCSKTTIEEIFKLLKSLDPIYFYPLYFHFVLEKSIPETANILNQKPSTTSKQILRGKQLLLKKLKKGNII